MELSGALSNPFATDKGLLRRLVQRRSETPVACTTVTRTTEPRRTALLELAELVLRREARPMRLREIHFAASTVLARELPAHSMKQALSANLKSRRPRFRRLSRGLYDLGDNSVAQNAIGPTTASSF
jgi:hypothetical protein